MQITKIVIRKMKTLDGHEVEYARITGKEGNVHIGQSVMLHRLTPDQLARARLTTELA